VDLDAATRHLNRGMIAFDLALGTGALLAPDTTLRMFGHAPPSPDARPLPPQRTGVADIRHRPCGRGGAWGAA
jgi:hypothetical protein